MRLPFFGGIDLDRPVDRRAFHSGAGNIVCEEDKAREIKEAAEEAEKHHGPNRLEGLQKVGVLQEGAVGVGAVEHEALRDSGDPHGGDVKQDANHPEPEVQVGEALGEEFGIPESRGEPVEQARRHKAVPAEGAAVDVSNCPVGVMREGVDGFDRHEGTLEGGHPVEGNARCKEFNNGVGAEFIPSAAKGEEAV